MSKCQKPTLQKIKGADQGDGSEPRLTELLILIVSELVSCWTDKDSAAH